MTANRSRRVPSLRHHKATGQGFVEADGHRYYFGRLDRAETREKYHRFVAEWLANGGRHPVPKEDLTVSELIAQYWQHAQGYYCRLDGSATHEVSNIRQALRSVRNLYGTAKACEFGPLGLKAVRQRMVETGWCRANINRQIGRIKRMFRWAVENELVSPTVYHGLKAVSGLKQGRTEARESDPVTPVPDSVLAITLLHMTPTLRAMVEVQRLTGMRPGEVCMMRVCDLEMSGRVWTYRPQRHKTQHHGRSRVILIGPKAQEVLRPFLTRDLRAHVFSPAQSEAERRMAMHAARKTPMSCGNVPGSNRRQDPKRTLGDRYNTTSYGRAIAHACKRAFPPPKKLSAEEVGQWHREHRWSPNRLRHTFATDVRREHGLEAAQVLLGHAQADVTQVYAERDLSKAVEVAAKIG